MHVPYPHSAAAISLPFVASLRVVVRSFIHFVPPSLPSCGVCACRQASTQHTSSNSGS